MPGGFMENKNFIENSELRIAICDDDKSDREKVHILLQDYLKKKSSIQLIKRKFWIIAIMIETIM